MVDGFEARLAHARADIERLKAAVERRILGQSAVVDQVLWGLLASGHVLLEGNPGLGKTLLVRTLAACLTLDFSRIQFTPDLMPSDVTGTNVLVFESTGRATGRFELHKGPIFGQIVLADEINRATPKTQSALLEAMQEHRVTVGRTTHALPEPYLVLATQNPLEMEGTYPLPEAQLDRFFFKLEVPFPSREELHAILERTTSDQRVEVRPVLTREDVLAMQDLVRRVPAPRHVQDYAIRVLQATHPNGEGAPRSVTRYVRTGASPRGVQAMLLGAKVRALYEGRFAASIDDVRATAKPALRHRLLLSFEGEAEGVRPDTLIGDILDAVPAAKD